MEVWYVLVCRVACGDFYYTEAFEEPDATTKGKEADKDATLAVPPGEAREFIQYQEDQVYAEYILEIVKGSLWD